MQKSLCCVEPSDKKYYLSDQAGHSNIHPAKTSPVRYQYWDPKEQTVTHRKDIAMLLSPLINIGGLYRSLKPPEQFANVLWTMSRMLFSALCEFDKILVPSDRNVIYDQRGHSNIHLAKTLLVRYQYWDPKEQTVTHAKDIAILLSLLINIGELYYRSLKPLEQFANVL
ncbi:hypothetical protein CEXT_492431 [Caerostris extrusa]|uniref:Uncharacterized protein n=1 Tax=Caerostris extrusa TaxID=172846 RepID=A0AAV4P2Z1_CAEEX|nr:hypothetical protein CEXT_492431 [Caerostris extrusa]